VARDLTIFKVHLLAIQHITCASDSLVTGTTAKSQRRIQGATTCITLSRSCCNEGCILY